MPTSCIIGLDTWFTRQDVDPQRSVEEHLKDEMLEIHPTIISNVQARKISNIAASFRAFQSIGASPGRGEVTFVELRVSSLWEHIIHCQQS